MRAAPAEGTRRTARWAIALACASLAACAPKAEIVWPSGAPVPSAGAVPAFERAARACRAVESATAEVSVSGRLGRERVRGRLLLGADRDGRLRVEALAPFGEPVFVLVAEHGRATLLLPREGRVLRDAPAGEVLDALAGLRIEPADLHALLAGCIVTGAPGEGAAVGGYALVSLDGRARVAVREGQGEPRIVSGEIAAPGAPLRVGYAEFGADGRPRLVRIQRAVAPSVVDLQFRLSHVETGVPLAADAVTVRVPPDASPMTLDDLRRSSPLAAR